MKLGCWLGEDDCVEIESDDNDAQAIIDFAQERGVSFDHYRVKYIIVRFPLRPDGTRYLPDGSYSAEGFFSEFAYFLILRCRDEAEIAQA